LEDVRHRCRRTWWKRSRWNPSPPAIRRGGRSPHRRNPPPGRITTRVNRNVAILMTAPGVAAIAVIRIKGPAVPVFLQSHFSKTPIPGKCVHGDLRDGDRVLDDAVVALVDEHTADLNVHGGTWVVQSVLDLARREGFEVIEKLPVPLPPEAIDCPGTLRQEILSHLPLARTETGVRALLKQEEAWQQIKDQARRGESIRPLLESVLADRTLQHLLHPPTVAIIGAANVGKSTLANQLFAQERSITADVPGTTRDWVGEVAHIDGLPVMLLDTPGLRATQDTIEATAIERAGEQLRGADLVVLVLDASRALEPEQASLIERFPDA